MVKRLCTLVFFLFSTYSVYAQLPPGVNLRYFTGFDNANPFDSAFSVGANGLFDTTVAYGTPFPGTAVRLKQTLPGIGSSISLQTNPINTIGQFKVWLDFNHIAKVAPEDSAKVEISVDGGQTWQILGVNNCQYLGTALAFRSRFSFAEFDYNSWQGTNPAGFGATPTNAWFQHERFDVSYIAANKSDVRFRFRYVDAGAPGLGTPARFGWIIDSIMVTSAFSELVPPVFAAHTPLLGPVYEIDVPIAANVIDGPGCDTTGIENVWVFFRINNGQLDSTQLQRVGTTTTWRDSIKRPQVADGDTVCYFLRAKDSSPNQNVRYHPNQTNPGDSCWTFITSGKPLLTHTPFTGLQFSAGPFVITANSRDASGIDSAMVYYRINGGAWQLKRLNRVGTTDNYRDTIFVIDGDTVDYYIESVDLSARRFRTRIPDTSWTFIASGAPTIEWPTTFAQGTIFLGGIYNLGPFNVPVRITDASNIDTAFMFYTINSGPLDSVGMTRIGGSGFVNWQGTIPAVSDSDTVCYYVKAYDASIRNNLKVSPDTSCRQFVALSGIVPDYVDNLESISLWNASLGSPSTATDGWILGTPNKSTVNATRSGTKAWTTGPLNADYAGGAYYILESPVFDLSTVTDPTLTFWMWRDINNALNGGDALWLEYTDSVTNPQWTKVTATMGITENWYNKTGQIVALQTGLNGYWDGPTNGYTKHSIRLTAPAFQNNPKKVRFRFVFRSTATFHGNGIAIDDISLTRPIQVDVNMLQVTNQAGQPFAGTQVISGDPYRFGVVMRNFGQIPLDSVNVVWEVNGNIDTTLLVFTPPLAVNAQSPVRMLDTVFAGAINCWSDIKVYAIHPNDGNRLNDTLMSNVYGIPVVRFPYLDNFDSTAACNWLPIAIGNNNMPWELGTPNKTTINAAFSAPNAWTTQLTGNPPGNSQGYLFSPLFDFSNSVNGLLTIRLNRRFASGSGLRISYADENFNNFWQVLGTLNDPNPNSSNWYNGNIAIAAQSGPAFTGISTTGYSEHTIELPTSFNYRSNRVRFRVEFGSGIQTNEGVAFDNFHLYDPPAIDVNLLAITRPVACPDSLKATDTIQVIVKNSGKDTIRGVSFNYEFIHLATGTVHPGAAYTAPDTIAPAATANIQLPPFASPPAPFGDYTLRIFTTQAGDGRRQNDTLTRCVKTIPPVDLIMTQVLAPLPTLCYPAGLINVRYIVRNIGHSTATTYNAYYKLDTLPAVMATITRPVAPNAYDTVDIPIQLRIPIGPATLRVYVNSNLDNRNYNDSAIVNLEGLVPYDLPYFETYETYAPGTPPPYCYQVFNNSAGSQLGLVQVQSNVQSASNRSSRLILMGTLSSGATAWSSTPNPWDPSYQPLFLTRMVLPVITDARPNIHVRFKLLQIAGNANLFSFLRVLANGQEVQRFQPTQATPATNPFITHDLDLSSFYTPGQPLIIEFQSKCRYAFLQTGNNRNGNLIDDLIIYHSVPNSANVYDVSYTPPFPTSTTPVTVSARIRNTGQTPLTAVTVAAEVDGVPLQSVNFSPNLAFLQDSLLTFTTTFLPDIGSNDVCVTVSQPNGQPDAYTLDDTLCVDAIGFDVIDNFPYCNDFDQGQPAWLTLEPFSLRARESTWVFGTPNKGHIDGPASAPNAWYIGADSTYGTLENAALYTPIFTLEPDSCYQIEFSSKWLTDFFNNDTTDAPLSGDGGTVEYSTNGGASWDFIGGIDSAGWYVSYIQSMLVQGSVPFIPGLGWSGRSPDTYTRQEHPFSSQTATQVLFRFRWASDNGFNGEGWSVDDFCFVKLSGTCAPLSVGNEYKDAFDVKQNYPNPFDYRTTIEYRLPAAGKVDLIVRDMVGRTVAVYPQGLQTEGEYRTEIDLSAMNAGVYFYTVMHNGQQVTKKMIISR